MFKKKPHWIICFLLVLLFFRSQNKSKPTTNDLKVSKPFNSTPETTIATTTKSSTNIKVSEEEFVRKNDDRDFVNHVVRPTKPLNSFKPLKPIKGFPKNTLIKDFSLKN